MGHGATVWTSSWERWTTCCAPILIKRGADLPLLLIFAGVIGGLVGFGIIGLFVGPVVLAVTYRLLESWVADIDRAPEEFRPRKRPRLRVPLCSLVPKQKYFHETSGHISSVRCVCNRHHDALIRLALAIW